MSTAAATGAVGIAPAAGLELTSREVFQRAVRPEFLSGSGELGLRFAMAKEADSKALGTETEHFAFWRGMRDLLWHGLTVELRRPSEFGAARLEVGRQVGPFEDQGGF